VLVFDNDTLTLLIEGVSDIRHVSVFDNDTRLKHVLIFNHFHLLKLLSNELYFISMNGVCVNAS
jgi:hypothetical protein